MKTITYSATTMAAITKAQADVDLCETKRLNGLAYAGKGEQMDVAKKSVDAANKAIMDDAIGAFCDEAAVDKVAMLRGYFSDWYVCGYKVVQDSDDDGASVHLGQKALRIPYSAIDTAAKKSIADNGAWRKYMTIFIDNCLNHWAEQDAEKGHVVTKAPLTAELLEKRKAMGDRWERKGEAITSKTGLCDQLNDVVAMVVPEELRPKMLKADVKTILSAVMSYKKKDEMGGVSFRTANAATLEEIVFRTIYGRMNGCAVEIQNEKQKPAPDTAGNPELNEKPAEGGAVTTPDVAEKSAA